MKIILLQDVPLLGKKYEIKEVKNGYANNFLFPKNLAVPATPQKIKEIENLKKKLEILREKSKKEIIESFDKISNIEIIISRPANEKGILYSKITPEEIRKEILKKYQININEDFIKITEPLKEIGEFQIPIEVDEKNKTSIKIKIEGEKNKE